MTEETSGMWDGGLVTRMSLRHRVVSLHDPRTGMK